MPVCKNKKEKLRKEIVEKCDFDKYAKDCRRILINLDATPADKCNIIQKLSKDLLLRSGGTDRPYIAPTKTKGFLNVVDVENPEEVEEVEEKEFGKYQQGGRRRRKSRKKRTKRRRTKRRRKKRKTRRKRRKGKKSRKRRR